MSYPILMKQCGSDHMSRGRSRAIDHIVEHYSGTLASARNNATYFARNERQGASAHFFVDDISEEIYQSVAEGDTAWHAGDWDMNCRSIGIEIISAGEDFSETEIVKAAWLTQRLQEKYGIPDANVIRHYDVTGKRCPAPYIEAGKWGRLKARLCGDGTWTGTGQGSAAGTTGAPTGSTQELACRVIAGEFGNGDERRRRLGARYDEVQAEVNHMLAGGGTAPAPTVDIDAIACDVIAGKYGNGAERKRKLGARYDAVQRRVNEIIGGGTAAAPVDVDALARAVIRGEYGNGSERKRRLGANYDAVQARVNALLS